MGFQRASRKMTPDEITTAVNAAVDTVVGELVLALLAIGVTQTQVSDALRWSAKRQADTRIAAAIPNRKIAIGP